MLYECTVFILDLEVSVVEVYGGDHRVPGMDDGAHSRCEERQLLVLEILPPFVICLVYNL